MANLSTKILASKLLKYFDHTLKNYTDEDSGQELLAVQSGSSPMDFVTLSLRNADNAEYCSVIVNFNNSGDQINIKINGSHRLSGDVQLIKMQFEIRFSLDNNKVNMDQVSLSSPNVDYVLVVVKDCMTCLPENREELNDIELIDKITDFIEMYFSEGFMEN